LSSIDWKDTGREAVPLDHTFYAVNLSRWREIFTGGTECDVASMMRQPRQEGGLKLRGAPTATATFVLSATGTGPPARNSRLLCSPQAAARHAHLAFLLGLSIAALSARNSADASGHRPRTQSAAIFALSSRARHAGVADRFRVGGLHRALHTAPAHLFSLRGAGTRICSACRRGASRAYRWRPVAASTATSPKCSASAPTRQRLISSVLTLAASRGHAESVVAIDAADRRVAAAAAPGAPLRASAHRASTRATREASGRLSGFLVETLSAHAPCGGGGRKSRGRA